jgi:hypothetical protein
MAMDLSLILAGPIVRRVEPRLAAVWVALRESRTVRLDVWSGAREAGSAGAPDFQASAPSLRVGARLHIAVVTLEVPEGSLPLMPERVYSYNLTLTGGGGPEADLRSLGLLEDRAARVEDGALVVKPHLALGYATDFLPTFVLPPTALTDLKILYGSCREPQMATADALTWVDDFIRDTRMDPVARPHQLYMAGDQIYADEPVAPLLHIATAVGNEVMGAVELLPTRWPLRPADSPTGLHFWPADHAHFPAGLRRNLVISDARLSTVDGVGHLLSLGEFIAMTLLVWCNELWPAVLPRPAEVFAGPVSLSDDLQIWQLHTGLGTDVGEGVKALCDDTKNLTEFSPASIDQVLKCVCRKRGAEFMRHRTLLDQFRAGLPKVRRALANVPTYMMFDDHEVTDDWYLNPTWRDRVLTSQLGKTIVRNGLLAFALCQAWGNDPTRFAADVPGETGALVPGPHKQLLAQIPALFPPGDDQPPARAAADVIDRLLGLDGADPPVTWHYQVPGSRHLTVVLDVRTRRAYASRISAPGNVSPKALGEQIPAGPLPAGLDVLILVSSLTVLGPAMIDELLGPMLFRSFDLFHHGNQLEMPGLHPDAIEAWPYDPETLESLLKRLEPYRRVVILSGDVHFATAAALSYWKKGDTAPARFAQFTSSGMKILFKDEARFAAQSLPFMQHVVGAGIGVERLGWNATAVDLVAVPPGKIPKPALRDRLRRAPVLLPTHGWPAGTAENPARPLDWTWRAHIVRDQRPDAERPAAARPSPLVPGGDVLLDVDGYRRAAVRHVKQLDNLNHGRHLLFASNIGRLRFERREGALVAIQELFAAHPGAEVPEAPEIHARHVVLLETPAGQPVETPPRLPAG